MTIIALRTDHELKSAITEELRWTPSVDADGIGIAVAEGSVTLSGQVATYPQKTAALHAALRVRGVTAVADEIVVSHAGQPHHDPDIARDAGQAVDRTVTVPSGAVKATVHDHTVTLSGVVDWDYQRQAAQHAVEAVPGVGSIWNTITLTPKVFASPIATKDLITSALVRHARTDAQHVQVAVEDGEVTLTGQVTSWAERRQAETAAWFAPGIRGIHNYLTVSD